MPRLNCVESRLNVIIVSLVGIISARHYINSLLISVICDSYFSFFWGDISISMALE